MSSSSAPTPPPDYATRKATFDMADAKTLAELLKDPATVLLDVRTDAEIAATGKFTKEEDDHPSLQYRHVPCTPTDATNLTMQAGTLFATKETPIIVYCMSGRRAHTARQALQRLGYTNVWNAGGLADIQDMKL
jgi:phage shock protein E